VEKNRAAYGRPSIAINPNGTQDFRNAPKLGSTISEMFFLNLIKSTTKVFNHVITRGLQSDKKIKFLTGINQPFRIYRPGEEDIYNMPDKETREWKEQNALFKIDARGMLPSRSRRDPLQGRPQMKGIVLKTLIKKPKKPNSANRKCVLVRLSNGKEKTCYVPGIGHNLQEHSNVLVRWHRVSDVPGLKLRVIRGVYDCAPIVKRTANDR